MKRIMTVLMIFVLVATGCATTGGKTAAEAESGIGITIWKIPIAGIGFWGRWDRWWGTAPIIISRGYSYQAKPPALPLGTPPIPSWLPAVDYPTIYDSAWDDPSLVVFKNDSYRKVRVEIDGQKSIVLEPYGPTADLHLGTGEHQVRLMIEKPTAAHGTWVVTRFFKINIRPEGRSQIIHLYE